MDFPIPALPYMAILLGLSFINSFFSTMIPPSQAKT
jgi:hypothetical protein